MDNVTLGDGSARNSMYAKPLKGSARQESRAHAASEPSAVSESLAGPGQYSLLGHEKKYENVDMEELEVQEAP